MLSLDAWFGPVDMVRLLLQRGMAAIYLVAFLSVAKQWTPLLGARGLLPVPHFLKHVSFREAPSLFHWRYSDAMATAIAWAGVVLAVAALLGITEAGPLWMSVAAWLLMWVFYLSFVNVGQTFFAFGWESMLLEAGFFAAFLGPRHMRASLIPVLALRWMFFRTELGAGLIKLRHDPCWRDLTCLFFHYETQPLPNPLSWYFHRLPRSSHRFGVLFSHFVQVVVPFGLFAPQPYAAVAAALCTSQQIWLIISGNYSWLNWITAVLGIAGLSDEVLHMHLVSVAAIPQAWHAVLYVLTAATVALSVQPVLNLFSRAQKMNFSYNRLHLVNTYGAFGSVGRERYEIVLEGTTDHVLTPATKWREYAFKAKPGDPNRMPPQVAPYHLRLDWAIWFLPFGVVVRPDGIHVRGYELWFLRFLKKLLANDAAMLTQMGPNPFPEAPPFAIRARFYRYRYTDAATRRRTGAWWTRELLGTYVEPVSAASLAQV